jgi:hypothetical protein
VLGEPRASRTGKPLLTVGKPLVVGEASLTVGGPFGECAEERIIV